MVRAITDKMQISLAPPAPGEGAAAFAIALSGANAATDMQAQPDLQVKYGAQAKIASAPDNARAQGASDAPADGADTSPFSRLLGKARDAVTAEIDPGAFVKSLGVNTMLGFLFDIRDDVVRTIGTLKDNPARLLRPVDDALSFIESNPAQEIREGVQLWKQVLSSPKPLETYLKILENEPQTQALESALQHWNENATPEQRGDGVGRILGRMASNLLAGGLVAKGLQARFPREYQRVVNALPEGRVDLSETPEGMRTIDISSPEPRPALPGTAQQTQRRLPPAPDPGDLAPPSSTKPPAAKPPATEPPPAGGKPSIGEGPRILGPDGRPFDPSVQAAKPNRRSGEIGDGSFAEAVVGRPVKDLPRGDLVGRIDDMVKSGETPAFRGAAIKKLIAALTPSHVADIHAHRGAFAGSCVTCDLVSRGGYVPPGTPHTVRGGGSFSDDNVKFAFHGFLNDTGGRNGPMVFGFPVPQDDKAVANFNSPNYYMVGKSGGGPLIEMIDVRPDGSFTIPEIRNPNGQTLLHGGDYTMDDLDWQAGSPTLPSVQDGSPLRLETYFYTNEALGYEGTRKSLEFAAEVLNTVPVSWRDRVSIGALPNPAAEEPLAEFYTFMAGLNRMDPTGSERLLSAGLGETNAESKEVVVDRMGEGNRPTLRGVKPIADKLGEIGGLMVLHMDAGTSPIIRVDENYSASVKAPSNYRNLDRLDDFLSDLRATAEANGHKPARIIWAHLGGMGRTIRPGPDHVDRLAKLMRENPNLSLDFSWDVAFAQFDTKESKTRLANLVNEFPDRIAFGTDGIGNSPKEARANLNIAKDEFLEMLDDPGAFLRGNAERWLSEANESVLNWRLKNADMLKSYEPTDMVDNLLRQKAGENGPSAP